MSKDMEGDNRQRRNRAKDARDEGLHASEEGVTTGASNQRRTLHTEDHEDRLAGPGWGKQQPDRVASSPRPGSTRREEAPSGASDDVPQGGEQLDVAPGELTREDEQVLETLARLEDETYAPSVGVIAENAQLPRDEVLFALQRLVDRQDVVQELSADDAQLGHEYRVKGR